MKHLIDYFRSQKVPAAGVAELAELVVHVNRLAEHVNSLISVFAVIESLLEDAGIMTPERLDRLKPVIAKKLGASNG